MNESDANVRVLAAAARGMLAALRRISTDGDALSGIECRDIARAAIAKATEDVYVQLGVKPVIAKASE